MFPSPVPTSYGVWGALQYATPMGEGWNTPVTKEFRTFYMLTNPLLLVSILLILNFFQWNFCGGMGIEDPNKQNFVGSGPLDPTGSAPMSHSPCSNPCPVPLHGKITMGTHENVYFSWFIFLLCQPVAVRNISTEHHRAKWYSKFT